MRQVFLDKGHIVVKDVCQPILEDHKVLVSVHYSFISSETELYTIEKSRESLFFSNVPQKIKKILESVSENGMNETKTLVKGKIKGRVQTLGYSCSGTVIAVGKKIKKLRPGNLVACAGANIANHADIISIPENLVVKVKSKEFLRDASLATIGSIAIQGIRRANLQIGEYVCVIGLGLLGQLTVQLAQLSGCNVIGIDILPDRLELAKKLGAIATFNPSEENIVKEIEFLTQHNYVDSTIITAASKSNSIIQQAMEITRKKGKVILVGDVGLKIPRNPFYKKEIDFLISCSYGPGRYDKIYEEIGQDYPYAFVRWTENRNIQSFVSLIEQGKINIEKLITQEIDIDNVTKAYELLKKKKSLGIVLKYLNKKTLKEKMKSVTNDKKTDKLPDEIKFNPAVKDTMRVGVIGAGGFAKLTLMPIIYKQSNAKINAIVDTDIANSINVSRLYGAKQYFSSNTELFKKDLVDIVMISSPHKYHCEQALQAMSKGKAVFLEKPMVTSFDQLQQMRTFLKKYPNIPFCVDYNRSFSPFMKKIKKILKKRNTPIVAHYRMNAGFIPKDHWMQTEVGAGRIIGEACHIFDLFYFFNRFKTCFCFR